MKKSAFGVLSGLLACSIANAADVDIDSSIRKTANSFRSAYEPYGFSKPTDWDAITAAAQIDALIKFLEANKTRILQKQAQKAYRQRVAGLTETYLNELRTWLQRNPDADPDAVKNEADRIVAACRAKKAEIDGAPGDGVEKDATDPCEDVAEEGVKIQQQKAVLDKYRQDVADLTAFYRKKLREEVLIGYPDDDTRWTSVGNPVPIADEMYEDIVAACHDAKNKLDEQRPEGVKIAGEGGDHPCVPVAAEVSETIEKILNKLWREIEPATAGENGA